MERCSLLNGNIANQDADYSAPLLALTNGGVVEWLQVSHVTWNNFQIAVGGGLIKCLKSNGDKVMVYFQNTAIKNLSFAWPKKVWIEIFQANLDNPLLNPITGLGIGQITFGASYPVSNYIALASIDITNTVTDERSVIKTIDDAVTSAISQIQSGATTFSAPSIWPANTYNVTYSSPIVASIVSDPTSIPQGILYFFKAHQDNTGNVTASVNTTQGTLTAPVKKMHDRDLTAWDIETNQRVAVQRDGVNFQMQSQLAQVPVGSIQNSTVVQVAGEAVKWWQPGFAGRWVIDKLIIKQTNGWWAYKMGDGTSIRHQFQFLIGTDNILRSVRVQIRKVGSPTDNVECRVMDMDRTTVIAVSTTSILSSNLSANFQESAFVFNDVVLTPNQRYIIDIRRSSSNSATNHYEIEANGTNFYPYGQLHYFDGTNWIAYSGCLRFAIQMGFNHEMGKWWLSDNDFESTSQVDGFFAQTKTANQQVEITVWWVNTNQIWLSAGQEYFLSNQLEGASNIVRDTNTHFGYQTTNQEKIAQSFVLNRSLTIDKILLSLWKQGNPTDNLIVRIETDTTDSPSGVLAHANAQCTINYTALSTGSFNTIFQFLWSFTLSGATKYRIVLSRSGALDTTNYYRTKIKGSNVFDQGNMEIYQNALWTANTRDLFFDFLQQFNGLEQNSQNTETYLWYSIADRKKQTQKVILDSDTTIKQICLSLRKDGTPTDAVKVRIETDGTQDILNAYNISWWSAVQFGLNSPNYVKVAGKFKLGSSLTTSKLSVRLYKQNLPTDNVTVRIETDNSWAPSGALVHPNAVFTVPASSLTTTLTLYELTGVGNFSLSANTDYWIVCQRLWTTDNSNYYFIGLQRSWPTNNMGYFTTTWNYWSATIMYIFPDGVWWPSGNLVNANAELTISATALTNSLQSMYLAFPASFTLSKNTVYRIVVERTGALSTTNFYRIGIHNGSLYHYGHSKRHSTGIWIDNTDIEDFFFNFVTLYKKQPGNIWILSRFNYFYKVWKAIDDSKISLDFDDTYIVSSSSNYREFRNLAITETISGDLWWWTIKTYYFWPRKFISIGFNGYISIRAEWNWTDFSTGWTDTQNFDHYDFGNRRAVRANGYAAFWLYSDGYGWNGWFCTLNGVTVSADNLRVKKWDIIGIGFTMSWYRNYTAPAVVSLAVQLNAIIIKASLVKNASLLVS
jgi:hypothetical protein